MKRNFLSTALLAAALLAAALSSLSAPLTNSANLGNRGWNTRTPPTSQGMALLADAGDVYFYDGTNTTLIYSKADSGAADASTTFGLGTGAVPGEVTGAWRAGPNFDKAWVFIRKPDGSTRLTEVQYVNPYVADQIMNPEGLGIADGHVFMVLQAFFAGTATFVKMVYKIDTVTGTATNLSGTNGLSGMNAVFGAAEISTSGGQAAWNYGVNNEPVRVQFYDGTSVREIDSGEITWFPHLANGRVVYPKKVSGVGQIFLYDSTASNPAPVQLTFDSTGANDRPRTDGQHIAWLRTEADGTTRSLRLYGGLRVDIELGAMIADPGNGYYSLQLQRGQVLWPDVNGAFSYFAGNKMSLLAGTEAWLGDGWIVYRGANSAFIVQGTAPNDSAEPVPPILVRATSGIGKVTLEWDQVLRVSSYNIYLAEAPGVTKDNYLSLPGGRRILNANSPFVLSGLDFKTYYFVVTSVEAGLEGPGSSETQATPLPKNSTWVGAGSFGGITFYALAADPTNGAAAFAAMAERAYKTIDGGINWTALAGGIQALTCAFGCERSNRVCGGQEFFGEPQRNCRILRSKNGGANLVEVVPDGGFVGEIQNHWPLIRSTQTRFTRATSNCPTMISPDQW